MEMETQSVVRDVAQDAQRRNTRSRACSSAKSVVQNACVCLRGLTATNNPALAITTGRPNVEDPSALSSNYYLLFISCILYMGTP